MALRSFGAAAVIGGILGLGRVGVNANLSRHLPPSIWYTGML